MNKLALALLLATAISVVRAQAPLADVQRLGPQVGERVPDFSLTDQHGERRTLASLMGPKGLMLVFFRSADWCPYCKTQLADLQAQLPEIARSGYGLAAISYDPVAVLKDFAARRSITFPLVSDPDSSTIRRYGIFNTTIPVTNQQSYGIPFPGTFVVDRAGIVQHRFFEAAYQERVTVRSQLLTLGTTLAVPVTTVTSPQARITTFLSDTAVPSGARFSIVLDIVPSAGVHIYAPGVAGYKPLQLTLTETPGLRAAGVHLPPPEDYVFAPLAEHVSVFQQPFRMTQDVVVDASPEGQRAMVDRTSLTIRGTLNYQACDDKVCFAPASVPLSWTVALKPLDRERSPAAVK